MHTELLSRMSYDPQTGFFVALVSSGRRKAGDRLGYVRADGYRMIMFGGRWRYAHRLAWFYVTGEWPMHEIDHVNGDRDDNRFANLRQATRSQNMMNTPKKGVCFHKGQKKWQASIRVNGKRTHLGSFSTEDEALSAYRAAASTMHGDFAFVEASKAEQPKQESLFGGEAA